MTPMTQNTPPATPDAVSLHTALQGSAALSRLRQLMAHSNARLAAIRPCLPTALAGHVEAGPLDDEGWSLLAANSSVAAKLRQLQPLLERALLEAGWPACTIRIKVNTR